MTVLLVIQPINLPLSADARGVIKIASSRVTPDIVVGACLRGATAEELAQQYPSITLADVYATISYYMQHQEEVKKIEKRKKQAKLVKEQNQSRAFCVPPKVYPLSSALFPDSRELIFALARNEYNSARETLRVFSAEMRCGTRQKSVPEALFR